MGTVNVIIVGALYSFVRNRTAFMKPPLAARPSTGPGYSARANGTERYAECPRRLTS